MKVTLAQIRGSHSLIQQAALAKLVGHLIWQQVVAKSIAIALYKF